MNKINKLKSFLETQGPTLALVTILLIFLAYTGILAMNLQAAIIPDEPAHFIFSKHYSSTWGIPPDTYETYSWGWYIEGNPFLYYWINGRIINLINLISPGITDFNLLISLRLVNVIYALGTVWFCFLLSNEVIQHRWWQLLPVFLLTNMLMFVFISAGVQYDNLANLLSIAGLYFLVRVIKHHNFAINSLAWMICLALGTLVKYPILPLALAMSIAWLIFTIIHYKEIFPISKIPVITILLSVLLVPLIIGNFAIYGMNFIKYQSITPPCSKILPESQCALSRYKQRHEIMALEQKLSIEESISKGYPSPLRYAFVDWVYHILLRSLGLIGHKSYFPLHLIPYYQLLFYITVILGLLNIFLWRTFTDIEINLLGITLFYTIVLLITNYNSELVYGFKQIAVQGRYLFPIIGAIVILFTTIMKKTPIRVIQGVMLAFTIGLIFFGGPLSVLLNYDTILYDWFI